MSAGMDITPLVAPDSQVINGYFTGGFRVSGTRHEGPLLVRPESTRAWAGVVDSAALIPLLDDIELLILGTGATFDMLHPRQRIELRNAGIASESMATPAACRTYNVLMSEGRKVAAALLPL